MTTDPPVLPMTPTLAWGIPTAPVKATPAGIAAGIAFGLATRTGPDEGPTTAVVAPIPAIPVVPATVIEGPESKTGRALENAYKYCPSGNVTRQISKWENWKIKNTRG